MMNEPTHSGEDCGADAAPDGSVAETPAVSGSGVPNAAPGKALSPEAIRALEEAEARRKATPPEDRPLEWNGRGGEEPTRYGDWERKGLAVDF